MIREGQPPLTQASGLSCLDKRKKALYVQEVQIVTFQATRLHALARFHAPRWDGLHALHAALHAQKLSISSSLNLRKGGVTAWSSIQQEL